jgi:hypothetical protein
MKGFWFYLVLAGVLSAAGYVSNATTRPAYLLNATEWYAAVLMARQPFYLRLGPGQEMERAALDAVGAPYTLLTDDAGPDAYPRVTVTSSAPLPFIASVRFERERDALTHDAFTAHYLCVFGVVLSVGDSFELPTPNGPVG